MWDRHGDRDSVSPAYSKGACSFSERFDFDDTGQNILGCLWPWLLNCMAFLVILSWAFLGQSVSFRAEDRTGFHGAG